MLSSLEILQTMLENLSSRHSFFLSFHLPPVLSCIIFASIFFILRNQTLSQSVLQNFALEADALDIYVPAADTEIHADLIRASCSVFVHQTRSRRPGFCALHFHGKISLAGSNETLKTGFRE